MNKIEQYEGYFEALATNYKPIGHSVANRQFASMSREEVMAGVRKNLNLSEWSLVLLRLEPKLVKNDSRQFYLMYTAAFEVVKENIRNDLDKVKLQGEAFDMCLELVGKMLNEHQDRVFSLGNIKDDSVDFYEINEVFDNCVGYGVEFQFFQGFSRVGVINALNWV